MDIDDADQVGAEATNDERYEDDPLAVDIEQLLEEVKFGTILALVSGSAGISSTIH